MQKRYRADDFIEDHQRSSHQRLGFKLMRGGKRGRRLHSIDEDRAAAANGIGRDRALLGKKANADEILSQLAVGLFSNKFVAGVTAPEIDAADLEKFPSRAAEEVD